MARDVFICHSTEDRAAANALVAGLEAERISCWIAPRNIMPGADYAQAIVAAIAEARALVLVFSGHANTSPHVGREVNHARHITHVGLHHARRQREWKTYSL